MAIIKDTNKEVVEMFVDWTGLMKAYKGEWVALKSDKNLSSLMARMLNPFSVRLLRNISHQFY